MRASGGILIGGTVAGLVLLLLYFLTRSPAPENGAASNPASDGLDAALSGLFSNNNKSRSDQPGLVSGTAGATVAAPTAKPTTSHVPAATTTPANFNLPGGHFEFEHVGDVGHFVTDEIASLTGKFKVTDIQNFSTHKTVYYHAINSDGSSAATQTRDVALGGPIPAIGSVFSGFGG